MTTTLQYICRWLQLSWFFFCLVPIKGYQPSTGFCTNAYTCMLYMPSLLKTIVDMRVYIKWFSAHLFILQRRERYCRSKTACPGTHHKDQGPGLTWLLQLAPPNAMFYWPQCYKKPLRKGSKIVLDETKLCDQTLEKDALLFNRMGNVTTVAKKKITVLSITYVYSGNDNIYLRCVLLN